MHRLHQLCAVVRTGYLNRVRDYRFLVILGLTIVAGYVFVPPPDAGYATLVWSSSDTFYRGIYNSEWIGATVALLTGVFLSLTGFFVVKDTIRRDEETRVGQIIASTPLSNSIYVLGNALCNFAVLSTMVLIVLLTAVGMQLIRGEDLTIDLWGLMGPFLVFVLPLMLLVGAIAVLFETRSLLRGGIGSITYAFGWMIGLPLFSESMDLFGIDRVLSSMGAAGLARYPEMAQNDFMLGFSWGLPQERALATFTWQGIGWSSELLQIPLLLVFVALGVCMVASMFFARFDPAHEARKNAELPPAELSPTSLPEHGLEESSQSRVGSFGKGRLTRLDPRALSFRFAPLLFAELQLILKDLEQTPLLGRQGFAVAGAFIVLGLLLPLEVARGVVLPVAWLLPVLVWSKMGTREAHHHTHQIVYSSPSPLRRQLPAVWLSGVLLAILTGCGVAVNLALHSQWFGVLAWLVGALFIPSLALCLGVWTGSAKSFEFIYAIIWYIGPINQSAMLDFMGVLPTSVDTGIWRFYMLTTLILLALALLGRKARIDTR